MTPPTQEPPAPYDVWRALRPDWPAEPFVERDCHCATCMANACVAILGHPGDLPAAIAFLRHEAAQILADIVLSVLAERTRLRTDVADLRAEVHRLRSGA